MEMCDLLLKQDIRISSQVAMEGKMYSNCVRGYLHMGYLSKRIKDKGLFTSEKLPHLKSAVLTPL